VNEVKAVNIGFKESNERPLCIGAQGMHEEGGAGGNAGGGM